MMISVTVAVVREGCDGTCMSVQINTTSILSKIIDQGRMKFVRPLYRDLYAWEEKRQQAIDTFKAHRQVHIDVAAGAFVSVFVVAFVSVVSSEGALYVILPYDYPAAPTF